MKLISSVAYTASNYPLVFDTANVHLDNVSISNSINNGTVLCQASTVELNRYSGPSFQSDSCIFVGNAFTTSPLTTSLTTTSLISPSPVENPSESEDNTGAIIGGVVGGILALFFLGLIIFLVIFIVLRKKKSKQVSEGHEMKDANQETPKVVKIQVKEEDTHPPLKGKKATEFGEDLILDYDKIDIGKRLGSGKSYLHSLCEYI